MIKDKQCYFKSNNIKHIDYKNVELLKRFLGPNGNILAKKRTGVCSKSQRQLENAIKRSRFMGLIPYVQK